MKNISIDFVLDAGTVRARVHLPTKGLFMVDTQLHIQNCEWDLKNCRPNNIYTKTNKRINEALNRIRIALASWLKGIGSRPVRDIEKGFRNCVVRSCKKSILPTDKRTLIYHIHNYIQIRKHLLSPATFRRYNVFLALLRRFEGHIMHHLTIKEVNASFVQKFLCFGHAEGYSQATLHRSIAFVRTVLHFIAKRGIRTMAHELELPRIRKKTTPPVTLSEEELLAVRNVPLPKHLQHARDWLIISCYTGQRISDFMRFCPDMFRKLKGTTCIAFTQQKTARDILLPLHPEVLRIIQNLGNNFPIPISRQQYNPLIREVAKRAGIKTLLESSIRKGHRTVKCTVPKWQAISSHIGRRSFATNFYGKIPTPLLMEATGHASESMFQRYVNHQNCAQVLSLADYLFGRAS